MYVPVYVTKDGKEVPDFVYDVDISHEGYGHGKHTPQEGWHDELTTHGMGFKSFLNIVEDARIEKLVKRAYPGIKKSYVLGYKWFWEEGHFRDLPERINDGTLMFIDRINLNAKIGSQLGAMFTDVEQVYIDRVNKLETWDEVVELAHELFEMAKEDQKNADKEDFNEPSASSDKQENEEVCFDEEQTDQDASPSDSEAGEADSDEDAPTVKSNEGGRGCKDEPMAESDEIFSNSRKEHVASEGDMERVFTIPTVTDPDSIVIGYKSIIDDITDHAGSLMAGYDEEVRTWKNNNTKIVNYLAKEFEMKKAAAEHARTATGKTGVIDPSKLHSYQFDDNIFKTKITVAQGKNHGLLMYLDWSGSIRGELPGLMEQVFNLVAFCRKVNIPYTVYAFTDNYTTNGEYSGKDDTVSPATPNTKEGDMVVGGRLRLLELFTSKMSNTDHTAMMTVARYMSKKLSYSYRSAGIPPKFKLGGTPMNAAAIIAMEQVKRFKAKHNLQIVNTVFLTDGASNKCSSFDGTKTVEIHGYDNDISLQDPSTKRMYDIRYGQTKGVLEALRDVAGVEVAGFYLLNTTKKYDFRNVVISHFDVSVYSQEFDQLYASFLEEKVAISTTAGYSELYVICGGKNLMAGNTAAAMGHTKGMSPRKLATAFKNANKARLDSRVVLQKFIKLVA